MKINQELTYFAIVGTTSSGKTKRALKLAETKLQNVEGVDLISVDSRQVYKGLEVLTGADVPDGWQQRITAGLPYPFFVHPEKIISLHGVSIRELTEDWSLGQFVQFARNVMIWSWENSRLPILVGGTGLYHTHLFSDDPTPHIGQDKAVRAKAETMSIADLQQWLKKINIERFEKMNQSDRANPRRLVRAIEVELAENGEVDTEVDGIRWSQIPCQTELLTLPLEQLKNTIEKRVEERFASGAVEEVKRLLALGLPQNTPVLTTLGVPEISQYLSGDISVEECQRLWSLHEYQYAKRQLTWWKRQQTKMDFAMRIPNQLFRVE